MQPAAWLAVSTYAQAARIAVLLAFTAGGVDAIGFLTLARLFTAHMSGNSAAFGVALGQADVATFVERGFAIGIFGIGIAAGTALVEVERRRSGRHPFVVLYALEAVLLALFWTIGAALPPTDNPNVTQGLPYFALGGLLCLAMGLQNATLRRVGRQPVHTTYVTSVLSYLAEGVVRALFRPHDSGEVHERLTVLVALWVGYVLGAAAATLAQARWAFASMSLPLACLLVVLVIDARQPHDLGGGGPV